jgi:hypothetical protein
MPAPKNWHRLTTFALLACALALVGCGKNAEPTKPGEPKPAPPGPGPTPPGPTPPAPPADLSKAKPEATYTVQQFVAEMTKDSNFPVSKHAGKVIDLTGVVSGYGFGPNAGAFLLESEPGKPLEARPYKAADVSRPWTKALPAQTVVLRAQVGKSNNVPDPYPWQFVEAKGAPPMTQTAEQLVKERAANEVAFNKKYADHWVLVTGTVAEVKKSDGGGTEFRLKAGDKEQLLCTIPDPGFAVAPLTPPQAAALKPGTKVKLLGQPVGDRVAFCIVLDPAP